ncbi:S66 family peptidase [Vagococcus silagei]|uniref:LD-carboxypeptidase n=1 Tax=Vagococcus silagei TaxID=2508885 RepID=A0A4S3AZC7_9ENTE|nr:S66 peptidase family protein [Vagococcus silagei]THB60091.1 LD-carboxypeptidase [Vagococcus silagei]
MIKAKRLESGDKVAIVSLSSGLLGEPFTQHNVDIGTKRLKDLGLVPVMMPNALKGIDFVAAHPEARAADLIAAFQDDEIKGIICAIGGDDTYKTLPYLMNHPEFKTLVKTNPKLFTGFSDTTINHLMFYHLGLTTYYGMSFITDLAEISDEMLPYTAEYFNYYLANSPTYEKIVPSPIWYDERLDFSDQAIGQNRVAHRDDKGFVLLQGSPVFEGQLLGGCIDSLHDMLTPKVYADEPEIVKQSKIFPSPAEWAGKVLFIETSELKETPEALEDMLSLLKEHGMFNKVSGVIIGKPQDETYYTEYISIILRVIDNPDLSVVYNVNFGHATPRCVLPYGVKVRVDTNDQSIRFLESVFAD